MPEQNYANHVRYHPLYHFFITPVVAINILVALWITIRHFSILTLWNLFMAVAIGGIALVVRVYALTNQNRIIRLEERLRLMQLLPDDLRLRIPEIATRDLIALRFAPDAEVVDLTRAILANEAHGAEIKKRVKNWRPDYLRA